jgi:hypothetical protein
MSTLTYPTKTTARNFITFRKLTKPISRHRGAIGIEGPQHTARSKIFELVEAALIKRFLCLMALREPMLQPHRLKEWLSQAMRHFIAYAKR